MAGAKQNRKWPVAAVLAVAGLTAFSALGCGTEGESASRADTEYVDPEVLVLGFLPSQKADAILPDAKKMGEFLSQRMGRKVDVMVPTAYAPLIEGLRFGHVHAAFLDGGPGWIAHRRTGAEVILAEVKDGRTSYWAEAFVREGSPISSIDDVVGKRIAFTSRMGSSGFLMPIGSLINAGMIQPEGRELVHLEEALRKTFANTIEAGGYQQALLAILEDRADVAFGSHDAPERFLSPADQTRIRRLHRFGTIPSHAVMVAGNLAPEVVESLREAMLALNEPENLPLLRAIYGVDGLTPADTEGHLGEFGRALSALPGIEKSLLEKTNS